MSNYAFLCCSAFDDVQPSRLRGYSVEQSTVACDVGFIPLLWLGLFRATALRKKSVTCDGARSTVVAPVVTTAQALENLEQACSAFEQVIGRSIQEHAERIREGLLSTGGAFVTLELLEVEALHEAGVHRGWLKRALEWLADPASELCASEERRQANLALPEPEKIRRIRSAFSKYGLGEIKQLLQTHAGDPMSVIRFLEKQRTHLEQAAATWGGAPTREEMDISELLVELSGIRLHAPFPTPTEWLSDAPKVTDAAWNYARLLGCRHVRETPWGG